MRLINYLSSGGNVSSHSHVEWKSALEGAYGQKTFIQCVWGAQKKTGESNSPGPWVDVLALHVARLEIKHARKTAAFWGLMEQKDLWEPQKSRLSRSEKYEWMGQPELSGTGLGTACGSGCGRPCARLCSAPRKSSEPSPATPAKTHTPLVSDNK